MTKRNESRSRAPGRRIDESVLAGRRLLASAVAAGVLLLSPIAAEAIVFQVNSNGDQSDASWGDGLCSTGAVVSTPSGNVPECTLRAAIEESNAWPGRDAIRFSTNTTALYDAEGAARFFPASDYQPIVDPVDIDGTTAPAHDPTRTPRIVILGNGGIYGLHLLSTAADSSIRGLTIGGFAYGILLNGTDGAWIDRCAFGIHDVGTGSFVAKSGNGVGIHVNVLATDTWIGAKVENDAFVGRGNVISGNDVGIEAFGTNTRIIGNRIGTDSSGTRREAQQTSGGPVFTLGNTDSGIRVERGVGLEIGRVIETGTPPDTTFLAKGNLISNNGGHGIEIVESSNSPTLPGMTIVANRIGTDDAGLADFGNALSGIYVSDAAADLVIGGEAPEAANQVAGNDGDGIGTSLGGVGDTVIAGNLVGVASDGTSPLPNAFQGIRLDGGDPVLVRANVVGHSPNHGILIGEDPMQSVGDVRVVANFIGTTAEGEALPNGKTGIRVVNGDVEIRANTIGNNLTGITLGPDSRLADVVGNYVGTDALGRDLGNTDVGIRSTSSFGGHEIGRDGEGNVVGWNGGSGILIEQASNANLVVANHLGVHPNGIPIPNEFHGIRLLAGSGTFPAVIGSELTTSSSDFDARGNHIRYNLRDGISMQDGTFAAIRGNRIADNANLAIDLNEDGPSPNDFGDADTGANRLQNFPELDPIGTRLEVATGDLRVEYRVTSDVANTAYPLTIDFYLADSSGLQPWTYLGSDSYPDTDAHLQRRVQFQPAVALPSGLQNLVAVATSAIGDSSEVSAPVVVPEPNGAAALLAGLLSLAVGGRRTHARDASAPLR